MQTDRERQLRHAEGHLSANDPVLAELVKQFGTCTIQPHSNYYQELVESIIGQQLSVKAAATITARFHGLFGGEPPLPGDILAKSPDELRSAGLSRAKATYVQDLAQHILDGRLEINKLPELENAQIITELTAVKGIGEWTAHMFLIFSLGRLDVLPVGDLGIRNGIQRAYHLPQLPDAATVHQIAAMHGWHPYESVASWYIWKSLDNQSAIGS
jgi:DNA-3-methyladenine glycosylase II